MVFRDTSRERKSWEVGVLCIGCPARFAATGDDLVKYTDPGVKELWGANVRAAHATCPSCGTRVPFPKSVIPKWLWSRIRIEVEESQSDGN